MTNHVHLLLTPAKEESPALLMKHLGQRYVQYINRTYRRSGTLWEGRFRSCLARDEEYVFGCYRYIELNPVRAAMVAHAGDYKWSSYRANGEGRSDPLLMPHADYVRLGSIDDSPRANYRALFKAHLEPELLIEIRRATNGNFVLCNERFKDEVAQMLKRRAVPGKSGRPLVRGGERLETVVFARSFPKYGARTLHAKE